MDVLQVHVSPQVRLPLCLELLPGEVRSGQESWASGAVRELQGGAPGRPEGQRVWGLEGGHRAVHMDAQGGGEEGEWVSAGTGVHVGGVAAGVAM